MTTTGVLTVVGAVVMYVAGVCFWWVISLWQTKKESPEWPLTGDDVLFSLFMGIVWPISMWIILGMMVSRKIKASDLIGRTAEYMDRIFTEGVNREREQEIDGGS